MVLTPDQINTEQALSDFTTKRDTIYLHSTCFMVRCPIQSPPIRRRWMHRGWFKATGYSYQEEARNRSHEFISVDKAPVTGNHYIKSFGRKPARSLEWGSISFYPQGSRWNRTPSMKSPSRGIYRCFVSVGNNAGFAECLVDFTVWF